MSEITMDECIDFLLEGHGALIDLVQVLSDESRRLKHLLCGIERDISKVQEVDDDQLSIALSKSLSLLNLRADSALEAAKVIKNLTEAMKEAPSQTEGFFDEQE